MYMYTKLYKVAVCGKQHNFKIFHVATKIKKKTHFCLFSTSDIAQLIFIRLM